MKLLFCKNCEDIFKLHEEIKRCKCGRTYGRYIDKKYAEYFGEYAVPLGFNNYNFAIKIMNQPLFGRGLIFEAFIIPKTCESFIKKEIYDDF